jgi:hypothetical protein
MDSISFLDENAGTVQSTFAGIVAVATAIYVFYTARMFGQMRYSNQRLEAANDRALLEPGRRQGCLFELTIRNSGNVSVRDVSIDVDPEDFPSLGLTTLRSEVHLQCKITGASTIPSRRVLRFDQE